MNIKECKLRRSEIFYDLVMAEKKSLLSKVRAAVKKVTAKPQVKKTATKSKVTAKPQVKKIGRASCRERV